MTTNDIITLPFTKAILEKTAANTIQKYSHTHKSLMYGRSPVELLDNIFMGDLAKNALLEYLRMHCNNPLIDYDEIRTDNFKEHDPGWDIKAGNRQIKMEIKSSIPPQGDDNISIIDARDIKITASHDKGQTWIAPETIESYIHVQVYFYAKPYVKGYDSFDVLYRELLLHPEKIYEILNTEKYKEPLFFGWTSKKKIIHYVNTLKPNTWTFLKSERIYWRCPIKEAMTMPELITIVNSY